MIILKSLRNAKTSNLSLQIYQTAPSLDNKKYNDIILNSLFTKKRRKIEMTATGWFVLAVLGWIVCGFVGTFIEKGFWKRFYYEHTYVGWDSGNTALMAFIFLLGPFGVVSASISSLSDYGKIHIAISIPDEIREPTKEWQLRREATKMEIQGLDANKIYAQIREIKQTKAQKAKESANKIFI